MHINVFFINSLYPGICTSKKAKKQGYTQGYKHYPQIFIEQYGNITVLNSENVDDIKPVN